MFPSLMQCSSDTCTLQGPGCACRLGMLGNVGWERQVGRPHKGSKGGCDKSVGNVGTTIQDGERGQWRVLE